MSLDLGNVLQSQLGNALGRFLTSNGESAETSGKAASLAIPAVVAGVVKYVSGNPQHAGKLFDLVSGVAGNSLDGVLTQANNGSDYNNLISLGKSLLPSLLGGNAANASDAIADETGISKVSAGSLMAVALPLVLSFLRGHVRDNNLNQTQFLGLLEHQQGWLSQALNNKMLAALGISSLSGIFGGLNTVIRGLNTTPSIDAATGTKGSGAGKWIALAVAAALAAFAAKSCTDSKTTTAPTAPATTAASEASAPVVGDHARVVYEDGVAKFYFATGKNDIAEGAAAVVADVITAGKDGKKLVVSGFADSTGNAAANEELSKRRAQAVQAFFEAQGVNAANIELRKPDNTTGAVGNDVEGRRVEVRVEN